MKRPVKKLWKDRYAELRDYDVKECIQNKDKMKIEYNGEVMTLSTEDLVNKLVAKSKKLFISTTSKPDYRLYSYEWNPDETTL